MTWNDFYDKFYEWAESTQIRRISELISFGAHEEIVEITQAISNENAASRLVNKALAYGVAFTVDEIIDLQTYVTKDCMNELVKKCPHPFSKEQVEELVYSIDDDLYANLEQKYCGYNIAPDISEEHAKGNQKKGAAPGKIFSALAFVGLFSESSNSKNTHCFRIGDHVRVRYRDQEGTIIDINNGLYLVSLANGKFVDSYPESALERAW